MTRLETENPTTETIYIDCVGVDNHPHKCEPHKNICKCGLPIKSKKFKEKDHLRYGCYECDF